MKRYFLGIDIGTFESRGILTDESFRVAADASLPHGMNNPQPGWFEHLPFSKPRPKPKLSSE